MLKFSQLFLVPEVSNDLYKASNHSKKSIEYVNEEYAVREVVELIG